MSSGCRRWRIRAFFVSDGFAFLLAGSRFLLMTDSVIRVGTSELDAEVRTDQAKL